MKRIYLFDEDSRASTYGIGTYLRQVIELLVKMSDLSLNLVRLRSESREFFIRENNGYSEFIIPNTVFSFSSCTERYYVHVWYLLLSYIEYEKGDLLIFHLNYQTSYPLIALMKQRFPNCKIIYTIHCQSWSLSLKGNISLFKRIIHSDSSSLNDKELRISQVYQKEKLLYAEVDKIICLSNFTKSLLMQEYEVPNDKLCVINNGLEDKGLSLSENDRCILKDKLGIPINQRVVLFVGRIDEMKGIKSLIQSFKIIVKYLPDCHLYLLGDGNYFNYFEDIIGYWNRITFTGRLNRELLYEFYRVADVGVMPSFYEQCSYVAIEMLMFNIPLLMSTAAGLDEMVENVDKIFLEEGREGISISSEKMAENIMFLLNNSFSDFYRNVYLQKYEKSIFDKKMNNLYDLLTC